jgi:hypothetical protein
MTAQFGRTVSKWVTFKVDDSAATLREIAVDSINGVGLEYDQQEFAAFQDALHTALPNHANAPIEITGPFDTTAATGTHTVLSGICGGVTPLALGVFIGIQHVWEAGEPVFGITGTTANGYLCTSYQVDFSNQTYTARFVPKPGSAVPAWGTTAIT